MDTPAAPPGSFKKGNEPKAAPSIPKWKLAMMQQQQQGIADEKPKKKKERKAKKTVTTKTGETYAEESDSDTQ